ncbi:hypothetical protein HPB52_012703 [Rhipicephalus sanguineus]|uniref:MD-2-related lipid-recognition domain-containing protein n=1 Tax=Rhipicephalus sanguineus TaxID=34632 RepID=A0A9D4PFC7_RHISA|nr:hypothetical protein HPB52_012703 [Rhipicephalus sanguineus]
MALCPIELGPGFNGAQNSDSDVITISDATVSNAEVGSTLSFDYTLKVSEEIDGSPSLSFEMSSGGAGIPCYENVGSCTYSMCGGSDSVEQQIGAPWDNTCPIAPDSYQSELNVTIPSAASVLIQESKLHVKIQGVNGDQALGCYEFGVSIGGVQ